MFIYNAIDAVFNLETEIIFFLLRNQKGIGSAVVFHQDF